MLRICLSLFLTGIFLGSGPCLISCGPFLVSFIAGANKSPKESFWIWLVFSLTRLFAYVVLGLIAGLFSQEIVYRLYRGNFSQYLLFFGGAFVLFLGAVMMLGKMDRLPACRILEEKFIRRGIKSTVLFALVVGFLPCAPLLAILSYVMLIAGSWYKGALYSLAFGLGTLLSPLIILVLLASFIPKLLAQKNRMLGILQKVCGLVIVLLGLELILKGIR
jgi:uncharacterized protein